MKLEIDVTRELGALIKAMRLASDITQEELALALNLSRGQVANIERGNCAVMFQHLVSTADKTGFEVKLTVRKAPVTAPQPEAPINPS